MAIKFSAKDQSKPTPAVKETEAEIATRERVRAAARPAGNVAAAPAKAPVDLFEDEADAKTAPRGKKSK